MSRRTTSISRQLAAELRFLHYSRRLVILLGVLAAGVVVSLTGSVSHARSAHENFVREVSAYESHGITLQDALAAPVTVTTDQTGQTIDNPLKYDYLEVARSLRALQGLGMVGTALDLVTFIVIPLTFLVFGAGLATTDRASGVSAFRGSRERWPRVVAAKILALAVLGVGAAVAVAVMGAAASVAGAGSVDSLRANIDYAILPMALSPVLPKVAMTALVALFFGVIGYAVGALTRSTSWPMVLAGLALFLLPFVSPWDPRNVLAVLGAHVYDFWGQFQMRPPIQLDVGTALAAVAGYLVVAGVVVGLAARRAPLR